MIILADLVINDTSQAPSMEDMSEVTEAEAHQGTDKKPTERTEMNKKPTSGKEIQNESEEKVRIDWIG